MVGHLKRNHWAMIADFDSTFVKVEALDSLFSISLQNDPQKKKKVRAIEEVTKLGMEGIITFPESLSRRFSLLKANKEHLKELIVLLGKNISDSIVENKKFFKDNSKDIYIISGGFIDYIHPIVEDFGIDKSHVLANELIFDEKGNISGYDKKKNLCKENGKTKAVKSLMLGKKIVVVGDGYTDYEIKKDRAADVFIAFCENVSRRSVIGEADFEAHNFNQIIEILKDI